MLRIVPKRIIYKMPYERLIIALTREASAAVRVNGSSAASWTWNKVKIALCGARKVSGLCPNVKVEIPHESSKADKTLSVFHSLTSESTKSSHECLNLARAGETLGGTHSSENGSTILPLRLRPFSVSTASHASIIR